MTQAAFSDTAPPLHYEIKSFRDPLSLDLTEVILLLHPSLDRAVNPSRRWELASVPREGNSLRLPSTRQILSRTVHGSSRPGRV